MPTRRRPACAAVLILLAAALPAGRAALAQPAARTTASLMAAEDKLFADQLAGNVAGLAQDLGDDLTFTHASGLQQTKAAMLAFVRAGKVHFKFIHPSDRSFRLYGQPGAQVGVSHEIFTIDIGLPHVLTAVATGVYVDRDGRWQLVAWQTTDIPQRAAQ